MKPTHVVADSHYGFLYTKSKDGHLLDARTANDLASSLNQMMPEGMKDYLVYQLIPLSREWMDFEVSPVTLEVSDAAH